MKYSDLRRQKRLDLVETYPLPGPLNVYLEPTNVCNLACKECPVSLPQYFLQQQGKHHLSPTDWETIAAQIEELGPLSTLHFYMLGEPLVNVNLEWYITEATQRCLAQRTILTTNGILLTEDRSRELILSGLDFLRVSLYDEQRPKIAANVRKLIEIRNLFGYSKPWVYVKAFQGSGIVLEKEFPFADEVYYEPTMDWNGTSDRTLGNLHASSKRACPMPFYTLVIHSNLKVSACCVDWDLSTIVGDLRTERLKDIWNGEKLRTLRRLHLDGRRRDIPGCRYCTYLHTLPDSVDGLSVEEFDKRTEHSHVRQ